MQFLLSAAAASWHWGIPAINVCHSVSEHSNSSRTKEFNDGTPFMTAVLQAHSQPLPAVSLTGGQVLESPAVDSAGGISRTRQAPSGVRSGQDWKPAGAISTLKTASLAPFGENTGWPR